MRRLVSVLFGVAIACLATVAQAERKLAFVAGINAYENLPADKQLERAVADATAITTKLRGMGYDVTEVTKPADSTQRALLRRFSDFKGQVQPGDTVVFFFSGHGVAFGSNNFLLPADIPSPSAGEERLIQLSSIAETDVIDDIRERGARIVVTIIDACRDNPFPKAGTRSMGATRGLAVKEPADGVFSIYSAGAGQTALDKLTTDRRDNASDPNPNSVFTRVLLREIDKPGQNLIDLGETLREEVADLAKSVRHTQVPAVYNQILGARRMFLGDAAASASAPIGPNPPRETERKKNDATAMLDPPPGREAKLEPVRPETPKTNKVGLDRIGISVARWNSAPTASVREHGLLVTDIAKDGSAAEKLKEGDIILKVTGRTIEARDVDEISDIADQLNDALAIHKTSAYFFIKRDGRRSFVELRIAE